MKIVNEISSKKEQYGTLTARVHDKYGNLLQEVEQPVDSFNRQFWRLFQNATAGGFSYAAGYIKALNNSNQNSENMMVQNADGGVNGYAGIVLGSGTTATTYNTVLMQSLITHGTSVGTLHAQETTVEFVQDTNIATVTRSFISMNSASGSIAVNEVGIATGTLSNDQVSQAILYVRDVLNTTLNVPYEGIITVQYKLRVFHGNNNYANIVIKRPFGTARNTFLNNLVNTTGSTINTSTVRPVMTTNEGNTRQGMIFGTSDTAFDKTQIAISALIPHGESSGQLFYHPQSNTGLEENSTTNSCRWLLTRSVENRSGAPIEIKEVAMYSAFGSATSAFMLDRKILDTPVTVPDGNIVAFWWEFCYEL